MSRASETPAVAAPAEVARGSNPMAMTLALLLASLVVAFGLCELAARWLWAAPLPWRYPQVAYRADPDLVFALRPSQRAFTADKATFVNADGFRGPMVPTARTPGRERILFLGDSIGFGYGVRDEEVVTARVAATLAAGGRQVEVVNTSVPAYNLQQEVAFLERSGLDYRPDWVVVLVCWNDISDKSGDRVSPEGWLMRAGVEQPGTLARFAESGPGYAVRNLLKRSRLMYGVTEAWRRFRARLEPDDFARYRAEVFEGQDTPRLRDGWGRVDGALARLKALSERHGFRVLLVTFPASVVLEGAFPNSAYPARLKAAATTLGLPVVDLEGPFRAAFGGHESLFIPYDADHPNARGHAIAAAEIVRYLEGARSS